MVKLNDSQAKNILKGWPERTRIWQPPNGKGWWLRCCPTGRPGGPKQPWLHAAGADLFKTQPDGLWAWFGVQLDHHFVDLVVFEVCGGIQNLNDKRARYMPATSSLMLHVNAQWFNEKITVQKGGKKARIDAVGEGARSIPWATNGEAALPVRHVRVLYAIPDDQYAAWIANHTPTGYEYFCKHSSLKSQTSQKMQVFLKGMSIASQFYTLK